MEKQNSTKTNVLSDKAFCRLMLTALFSTLFIIAIFCGTTYAWFTASTTTRENSITTGEFKLDAVALNSELETVYDSSVTRSSTGKMTFTLSAGDTYTITLTPTESTSVSKGHATVTVGDQVYITQTIYKDSTSPFSFVLTASVDTVITVKASWGMSARPTLENGGIVTVEATD